MNFCRIFLLCPTQIDVLIIYLLYKQGNKFFHYIIEYKQSHVQIINYRHENQVYQT